MKIWQELRRRRVFRLAGLYVVGAWLVKVRGNNDRHRALVEAADAGHDFRAEFDQLLSARPRAAR